MIALLCALIAALAFRTWLYTPYRVPSSSMSQTIEIGDHIFINTHAYGFDVPFSDQKTFRKNAKRGDIVIFPYPLDQNSDLIKRVIGIGGDEIQIIGETVYINGTEEQSDYLYFDPSLLSPPENIKVEIPEGKLWVMGDNRRNSKDSRYWGFVDESKLKGRASLVFWSHDPEKNLLNGYRFDRIGHLIR